MAKSHPTYNALVRFMSRVMLGICVAFTMSILVLLVLVTGYLVYKGIGSLSWSFFTQVPSGRVDAPGGMKHALLGTLVLVLLASSIGIPIGMLCGVYLAEYSANTFLAHPVRFIADVLTGVPSIVVGILGYELLVVPLGHFNGFAGSLALAFIMIPIVARTTEEMLRLVPNSYREASIALGATKARTIMTVVIPAATGSIVTGIMLAIARVAGETAPLLFTALGSRLLTLDPKHPFPSLTVQIYTYATGPYAAQRQLAYAGMIVLIALVFVVNLAIRFFTRSALTRA
jgi:phosphate transport system permease protein